MLEQATSEILEVAVGQGDVVERCMVTQQESPRHRPLIQRLMQGSTLHWSALDGVLRPVDPVHDLLIPYLLSIDFKKVAVNRSTVRRK